MSEQPPHEDPTNPQQPTSPPPGQYGYQYGYPGAPAAQESSGKAVAALVLGILGLVMCGPFTAIPAIFFGRSAAREIDASQGRLGGRGLATAGLVLGIVGAVLAVVALLAVIVIFVFGGVVSHGFEESCSAVPSDHSSNVRCD